MLDTLIYAVNSEFPQGTPRTASAPGERQLVDAARRGDHGAFGDLVRQHQRRVFRLAGRFFQRPEDVDDVAQEVFLRAWNKLETYRGEAPFEHWLTRLCLNICYQRLRRARPDALPLEHAATVAAAPDADADAGLDAARWLARLDPKDRFLLILLDGEGWSTAEIAERLGWSRVNVKVRAHRARKRLRRWLEGATP